MPGSRLRTEAAVVDDMRGARRPERASISPRSSAAASGVAVSGRYMLTTYSTRAARGKNARDKRIAQRRHRRRPRRISRGQSERRRHPRKSEYISAGSAGTSTLVFASGGTNAGHARTLQHIARVGCAEIWVDYIEIHDREALARPGHSASLLLTATVVLPLP